jgi:hypothetical protein
VQVRSDIAVALRVLNAARFSAGMHNASRAMAEFKAEVASTAGWQGKLAASSKLGEAAVYGLGTAVNTAALGFGALAAATIGFGLQFNATMESNSLAFSKFVGSGRPALDFTKNLFKIAQQTPFSFEDVTTAGRRLLAFGFNAKETTALLKNMGDTISYTGGSTDELLRLGKALGDIRAKGKLMQQEMNQLANVGIPIRDILAKGGLQLTERQLYNIGRANIPAQKAIDAIQRGLSVQYGGGAIEYMKTFNGQWQRLKDNLKFGAGAVTGDTGLFGFMKKMLGKTNNLIEHDTARANRKGKKGGPSFLQRAGGFLAGIGGGAFKIAKGMGKDLIGALAPAVPFLKNVLWPLFQGLTFGIIPGLVVAWKILIFAIKAVATVLGFLGKILKPFGIVFKILGVIIGFVFGGEILKALWLMSKLGGVFRIIAPLFKLFGFVFKANAKILEFFLGGLGRVLGFFISKFPRIGVIVYRLLAPFVKLQMAIWGFVSRFLLRIAPRFSAGIERVLQAIASGKFDFARALLNPKRMAKAELAMLKMGINLGEWLLKGIGRALLKLSIKGAVLGATGLPGLLHKLHFFADGGTLRSGALGIVGERGPELARHTASGTVITPLRGRMPSGSSGSSYAKGKDFKPMKFLMDAPVILKHREVGRVFGEILEDRAAHA